MLIVRAELDRRVGTERHVELRNNLKLLQDCEDPEVVMDGPARTGKTFACLWKLHVMCEKYPGTRVLLVRQTRESLTDTVLVTLERDVLGLENPIIGGQQRSSRKAYNYPNSSAIIISGIKQSGHDQKAKLLSSEYDFVYIPQAEEVMEDDWQKLSTRLSNFRAPYQQMLGDCNADSPTHWIYRRSLARKLTRLSTTLKDNPRWWVNDPTQADGGHWTQEGEQVLKRLSGLTGIQRQRLFEGKWVQATGLIYGDQWTDGPSGGNVTEEADYIDGAGEIIWAVDDGYAGELDEDLGYFKPNSHPRAILMVQKRADGSLNVFDESYRIGTLADTHLNDLLGRMDENGDIVTQGTALRPDRVVIDKSAAELRGRFKRRGIYTLNSPPDVEESIKTLQRFLTADDNGWRHIRVHPRCKLLRFEMANYQRDPQTQKPIKDIDHGPDGLRYLAWSQRHE